MPRSGLPDLPRFEVLERLGAGGMGEVYRAFDREYEVFVALKLLSLSKTGDSIRRFKNEFRHLQAVRHPNLVRFLELFEHEGMWFFTMELIDGVHFLEWVRPGAEAAPSVSPTDSTIPIQSVQVDGGYAARAMSQGGKRGILDEARLCDSLRQLCEGLIYLHSAGRIHRDIKPSNIMVTRQGRVILLDFGLATHADGAQNTESYGTPVYMAPEIVLGEPIGPESDWYSVGVMLYEALTDEQPFKGPVSRILREKRGDTPPPPDSTAVDARLNALCHGLMQRDARDRPGIEKVLQVLDVQTTPRRRRRTHLPPNSPLLGRVEELATLQECFEAVQAGAARTVYVHGESGLGKSELVREFGRAVGHECTVLAGQCYEKEAVPYKAVDGLMDALARFLTALDPARVGNLMPPDADLLVQAFPVLKQVRNFGRVRPTDYSNVHPAQLRSRVFASLRALLASLATERTLLLIIDDLQWADQDSLDLLQALLRQPQAPALLLVATIGTPSDPIKQSGLEERLKVSDHLEHMHMGPLSSHHAERLAQRLATELGATSVDPAGIVKEAGGHPMFIEVLVRYCYTKGRAGGISLNEALARHIAELDTADRKLLELLAVAGRPIARSLAARAADLSLDELRTRVDSLQNEKLVRSDGVRNTDTIEPYHTRVREVARDLPPADVARYYNQLALTFEAQPNPAPEALAHFWEGAEDHLRAVNYAEAAAARATDALAYERASQLYRAAIRLREQSETPAADLWVLLAGALVKAGRGSEAGDAFLTAAKMAEGEAALELQNKGAEQLLRCGRIDDGIAAINPVLEAYGFRVPVTRGQVLRGFLKGRLKLRFRVGGMRFKRQTTQATAPELKRIDVCWAATVGLFNVDQLRGLSLHSKHFLLALSAGEPMRVSRAMALEATGLAAVSYGLEKTSSLLDQAQALASEFDDPNAVAWVGANRAASYYLQGNWDDAARQSLESIEFLGTRCTGVEWEMQSVKQILRWVRAFRGELDDLREEVHETQRVAKENGDLYSELCACSGLPNLVYLIDDQAREARDICSDAIARWTQRGFHLQHMLDLYAQTQIDLYEGDGQKAFQRITGSWPDVERSGLFQVGLNRVLMLDLRARAALAYGTQEKHEGGLAAAAAAARKLGKEPYAWAHALAELTRAQLPQFPESSFSAAANLLASCSMHLHARVASALGTSPGAGALDVMASAGIVAPEKFQRLMIASAPRHDS